jgi:hypothetical protein
MADNTAACAGADAINVNKSTDTGTTRPLAAPNNSDSSTPTLITTCEKCAAIEDELQQKQQIEDVVVVYSVSCPDGQVVNISASTNSDNDASRSNVCTHMILGRGKHGIPSSAVHVSRRSCVIRVVIVDNNNTNNRNNAAATSHRLELVVLGSHPCRITRGVPPLPLSTISLSSSSYNSSLSQEKENSFYIKSISQILNNNTNSVGKDDMSPSSIDIHHGDVIEPYARPMDVNVIHAKTNGVYYPFTINIITRVVGGDEKKINGIATFAKASG